MYASVQCLLLPLPTPTTQILDRHNTRDVLRALLHSILFHRLLGNIQPKTFEVLDVTMVRLASSACVRSAR